MDLKTIIKKPLITEKAMKIAQDNRYTFIVDQKANKGQIKEAVRRFLKVEPIRVWTMKVKGEERWSSGRRRKIKMANFKKEKDKKAALAFRNIPTVSLANVLGINPYQVLNGGILVFTKESLKKLKSKFKK